MYIFVGLWHASKKQTGITRVSDKCSYVYDIQTYPTAQIGSGIIKIENSCTNLLSSSVCFHAGERSRKSSKSKNQMPVPKETKTLS